MGPMAFIYPCSDWQKTGRRSQGQLGYEEEPHSLVPDLHPPPAHLIRLDAESLTDYLRVLKVIEERDSSEGNSPSVKFPWCKHNVYLDLHH